MSGTNPTTPVTSAIPRIDKYSAFKAPAALWPYDRNSAVQYSNLVTFDKTLQAELNDAIYLSKAGAPTAAVTSPYFLNHFIIWSTSYVPTKDSVLEMYVGYNGWDSTAA
jgi:hypothetical protein